jgi:hypothetical protein
MLPIFEQSSNRNAKTLLGPNDGKRSTVDLVVHFRAQKPPLVYTPKTPQSPIIPALSAHSALSFTRLLTYRYKMCRRIFFHGVNVE